MSGNSLRYSTGMILIHWLTALFVLGAWLTARGGREMVQDPPLLHFALGLAVLALVVPRLILRLAEGAPAGDAQNGWLATGAKAGHGLLYLLLIGLPITGWYAASRMGVPISFLGVELPAFSCSSAMRPGRP